MGLLSRTKGATFERFAARVLRPVFAGAKRLRQSNTYEDRVEEPDVGAGPLDIECKHKKNLSRPEAIRDAKKYVRDGQKWAAIVKEHGGEAEIAMSLDTFILICIRLHTSDPHRPVDWSGLE